MQFYVYIHCKPDGTPFYIGKGSNTKKGKRSNLFYGRSSWHKRVVAKLGGKEKISIFVRLCESEAQSFEHEIWLIAYGVAHGWPLVNMTDGGDGISHPSTALRQRQGSKNKGNSYAVGNRGVPGNKHRLGLAPWNKGKKGNKQPLRSAEHCANISLGKKGKPNGLLGLKRGKYQQRKNDVGV